MSEPLKIGAKAPDFTLRDTDGADFTLSEKLGSLATVVTFIRGAW
jgi:peroxiredoxin